MIGRTAFPDGAQDVYNGGGSAHIPTVGNRPDVVVPLDGDPAARAADGDKVVYDHGDNARRPPPRSRAPPTSRSSSATDTMAEGSDRRPDPNLRRSTAQRRD